MSRRLTALVISNLAYEVACELKSPANDAEDIAVKLETWGFTVIKRTGCSKFEMDLGSGISNAPCLITKK